MIKRVLLLAVCVSANLSAQTIFFKQDFDDFSVPTWASHYDETIFTPLGSLPDASEFNFIRGGHPLNAILDTVGTNRSLEIFIPDSTLAVSWNKHFGRSISYYFGGRVVAIDSTIKRTEFSGGLPIWDAYAGEQNEVYLRYNLKIASNWQYDVEDVVKVPGLTGTYNAGAGGIPPDLSKGHLGWSARTLWAQGPTATHSVTEASPISYVYHLGQRCGYTITTCDTGDHIPADPADGKVIWSSLPKYQIGTWHRVEQRIKMNTYSGGVANANGEIEVWIDGIRISAISTDTLRFTTADSIRINRVWADIHYGGKYQSPADNYLYLDDFYLSTQPTPWSGTLVADTEWSGTVNVTGDITVPSGVTLTIKAGTTVHVQANSDDQNGGDDVTKTELLVYGTLNATEGNITLRSSNTSSPTNADWWGINVKPSGTVSLDNATVRDAASGVWMNTPASYSIKNSTFHHCFARGIGGVYVAVSGTISGNRIYDTIDGIFIDNRSYNYSSSAVATITNNLIYNTTANGIALLKADANVINNTVHSTSNNGLYVSDTRPVTVRNSSFTGATQYAIRNENGSGQLSVTYSNAQGSVGNFFGFSPTIGQNGLMSTPPHFSDGDYHLDGGSRLVDGGSPNDIMYSEPSGGVGRINMGRYGGNTGGAAAPSPITLTNGNFESTLYPGWEYTENASTWQALSGNHPGKSGTYYVSSCDDIWPGDGGCKAGSSESDTGIFRSNPFQITSNYLKFQLAGYNGSGCQYNSNYVRLRRASDDALLYEEKVPCQNAFTPKEFNVTNNQNLWVYMELVDGDANGSYAWIAVDDVRFDGSGGGTSLPLTDAFNGNDVSMYTVANGNWWGSGNRYWVDAISSSSHRNTARDTFTPNGDYNVEVDFKYEQFDTWNEAHLYIHWQDANNYIGVRIIKRGSTWRLENFKKQNGSWSEGVLVNLNSLSTGQNYKLKLSYSSGSVKAYVDQGSGYQGPYNTGYGTPSTGSVALGANSCKISFDNVHMWTGAPKLSAAVAASLPASISLLAGYPNPFNSSTLIRYFLPSRQATELTLYDLLGRPVRKLVAGRQQTGWNEVLWDGRDADGRPVATGVYLYRLKTTSGERVNKLTLLR